MATEKASKQEARLQRESLLWHAVAKHAGKLADRDRLLPGNAHRVEATIDGTVDGKPVLLSLAGSVAVNFDQVVSSSQAPPTAELLAIALAKLSKAAREKWLEELPKQFAGAGELPEVDEALVKQCEQLLAKLRYQGTTTRRGSVTFSPDPDGGAAAKAA